MQKEYPFLKNIFYLDLDKGIIGCYPQETIEALLTQATDEADKDLYRGILQDYIIREQLSNERMPYLVKYPPLEEQIETSKKL